MRLVKARVQNYRSVIDSGEFDIEELKTIIVGPNEAGKTVLLKAIQQLNKPDDVPGFDILRDYPRSKFNDIDSGKVVPKEVTMVTGYFKLEEEDKEDIPEAFWNSTYKFIKKLDNSTFHSLLDAPDKLTFKDLKSDLTRMVAHMDQQYMKEYPDDESKKPSRILRVITEGIKASSALDVENTAKLKDYLEKYFILIEEGNEKEEERYERLMEKIDFNNEHDEVLKKLYQKRPLFILFNNYYKVRPSIHLEHLAIRTENDLLDDKNYDYGNLCLLKLLGFTARELSDLGKARSPDMNNPEALKEYRDMLDTRSYKLNSASIRLTENIQKVWNPNPNRPEAERLKVTADGQYLKVVVEDDIGVDIELDQRSEGFQWLVSFFVVFFAEAMDKHKNAVILLDEPGVSLHAMKQRNFRETISQLSEHNQTIYTTHSPFLVGSDELDLVRVIELKNRREGTKVMSTVSSSDPAGLLTIQEAVGYDLAQSLFTNERSLILESITDYWYMEIASKMLSSAGKETIRQGVELVFASNAGKVVYYSTILAAHNLKVAALLDSDASGDLSDAQDTLVNSLGNKNILRTKDYIDGIENTRIEDMIRGTLVKVVQSEWELDLAEKVNSQSSRSIVDILSEEINDFSKFKLAKAFVKWASTNSVNDMASEELDNLEKLAQEVNMVLY